MKRISLSLFAIISILLLSGCSAIGTAVCHSQLDVQTLMSDSIFLPPGATAENKTVYLEIHNTTDKASFNITNNLKHELQEKGFSVVKNARQAHFVLQVNLLQMGRTSESAAKEMMACGYGGALEGAVAGGAIAYVASAGNPVTGGLIGGVATTVADNVVQNVTYSGIVDVKLTLRDCKEAYKTRILTMANRVGLNFEAARPAIEQGLVTSISGILVQ